MNIFATITVEANGQKLVSQIIDPSTRDKVAQADLDAHDYRFGRQIMEWIDARYRESLTESKC